MKVLFRTCEEFKIIVKLDCIASYENGIADAINRNRWAEAQMQILKTWVVNQQTGPQFVHDQMGKPSAST